MISEQQRQKAAAIRGQIKAITFDFWGTLVQETHVPPDTQTFKQRKLAYFYDTLSEFGHTFPEQQLKAAFRHVYQHFDALWKQAVGFDANDGIEAALQFLQVEIPATDKARLVRFFLLFVNETTLKLFPGVKEAIPAFAQRYRLGLISDTAWTPGRVLREQLRRNDLLHCFETLIFSGEVGHCKPHPLMFEKAIEPFGIAPQANLHVGDLQFTDIKGAKNFGCHAAWIYRPDYLDNGKKDYQPDLVVESVAELAELFL